MYEPKYLPQLNNVTVPVPFMRFGVLHENKYRYPDETDADPLHIHGYLEIFLNISGDVSFLVNNSLYPVLGGDIIISRPGDIHKGIFHSCATYDYVCVWIDADFASPVFSFLRRDDFCPLLSFDERTRKQLHSLIFSLSDACESGGSELEKISYLLRILTVLEQKSAPKSSVQADIPNTFQQVLDDINENFAEIRNVNDILTSHPVSSATLTRWFRKYLRSTPREYLESVRLSHAELLLSDGCSVTEACMRSGFSDCSHFIVLFKKKFGETPLKYKKKSMGLPSTAYRNQ